MKWLGINLPTKQGIKYNKGGVIHRSMKAWLELAQLLQSAFTTQVASFVLVFNPVFVISIAIWSHDYCTGRLYPHLRQVDISTSVQISAQASLKSQKKHNDAKGRTNQLRGQIVGDIKYWAEELRYNTLLVRECLRGETCHNAVRAGFRKDGPIKHRHVCQGDTAWDAAIEEEKRSYRNVYCWACCYMYWMYVPLESTRSAIVTP